MTPRTGMSPASFALSRTGSEGCGFRTRGSCRPPERIAGAMEDLVDRVLRYEPEGNT